MAHTIKSAARWIALVTALAIGPASVAGAFSDSNLNGEYAFSSAVTLNNPAKICNGAASCGGVNNSAGSLGAFTQTLVSDLKLGKCSAATSRLRSAVSLLRDARVQTGDQMFLTGVLSADGAGHFAGGLMTVSSTNAVWEALNFSDQGAAALLCGGGALDGDCSSLCLPASFGCDTRGGYMIDTGGTGTATIYAFPVAGSLCGARPTFTYAECCSDPTLAVVLHESITLGNVNSAGAAERIRTIFTDQGLAGSGEAAMQ